VYVYLAVALISAALSGAGVYRVQEWRYAALDKQRIEAAAEKQRMDEKRIDAAAVGHEKDKAGIRTVFRTITKEVAHVVEKPAYRNVCLDSDGLRVLSTAIHGGTTASVTAGGVPGLDRAD
jgi:hypothetical protein